MKYIEVMALLNEAEKRFPVDEWMVDDVHVWPLIRDQIGMTLCAQDIDYKAKEAKYSLNSFGNVRYVALGFGRYSRAYWSDRSNNQSGKEPVEAVFLTNTTFRRGRIWGKWCDIYCDPIVDLMREQYQMGSLVLEMSRGHQYKSPRYNPSRLIEPGMDCSRVKALIARRANDVAVSLPEYGSFVDWVDRLDLPITVPAAAYIIQRTAWIRSKSLLFRKYLKKANPKVGFVVGGGNPDGMAFCLACRGLNIISVELQHGVISDLRWRYGRWNRLPRSGYELLPRIFWCWDRLGLDAINEWASGVDQWHRGFLGGNLWLKAWQEGTLACIESYDGIIQAISGRNCRVNMLITMQVHDLPSWLVALIQSRNDVQWWIRLHPRVYKDGRRSELHELFKGCGNVDIDNATDLPLTALLRHMDYLVTEWSTTALDAAHFGVPSILIHSKGRQTYASMINQGRARAAFSAEEFNDAVQSLRRDDRLWRNSNEDVMKNLFATVDEMCCGAGINRDVL